MDRITASRPVVNNGLPVPLGFNLPRNRMRVDVFAHSDVNYIRISLYEYHGLFWYCLEHATDINSVGFVGLRNCVSSMRGTIASLGFRLDNPSFLRDFVAFWERLVKDKKGVA